jgi:uncharacterized protein (DUF58 family)
MGWFILILVLLAAAFGVLSIVLKTVIVIVLTILLVIAILAAIVWYAFKHQVRRVQRVLEPPRHDDRY